MREKMSERVESEGERECVRERARARERERERSIMLFISITILLGLRTVSNEPETANKGLFYNWV